MGDDLRRRLTFDELEEQRVKLYDQRTDVHRTLLAKEEELKNTDVSDFNGATEENIDITTLQEELNQVEAHNQGYYDLQSRIEK